ncbi:MAG TPA: hypothetical protein DCX53_05820, partial [Anaerolineae bacterium]|nr:hypothetical protein [Anaerolineae bacterium]
IDHKIGILACLSALAEIQLSLNNVNQSARLYCFVTAQLKKDSLQLMEPDEFAMKRLALALTHHINDKAIKKIIYGTERLSLDEIIKELNF